MNVVLSRRAILEALLVTVTGSMVAGAAGGRSLAAAAARTGRWFGAAVKLEQFAPGNPLRTALLRECSVLTPELGMKWAALETRRGLIDFSYMDRLADVATAAGKRMHGHALLWHKSIPDWARPELAEPGGWNLLARFFASVMPRYGASIRSWDVVNEPIEPGDRADGLRDSPFLAAFGPSYVQRALEQARVFAPRAVLAINEYGLDYASDAEQRRRSALLRLVEDLRSRGAPLDMVGIQAHLDVAKGPFDERVFADFLQAIAATGVTIAITELDVKEFAYVASPQERDRQVAELTGRYLDVALAQPAVVGVSTWGLSDSASWLSVGEPDRARYPGAWLSGPGPGLNRGLPLDAMMRRKPMYEAIERSFKRARTFAIS